VPISNTISTIAYTSHIFSHFLGLSTTFFGPLRGSAHHQHHLIHIPYFSHFLGYAPFFGILRGFAHYQHNPQHLLHIPAIFQKNSTYFKFSFIISGTTGLTTVRMSIRDIRAPTNTLPTISYTSHKFFQNFELRSYFLYHGGYKRLIYTVHRSLLAQMAQLSKPNPTAAKFIPNFNNTELHL
jgi:hypothetical protein